MTLEELRAALAYVEAELRSIHTNAEGRSLDETEQTRWNEGVTFVETTRDQIADLEAREEIVRTLPTRGVSGDGARDAGFQIQSRVSDEPADVRMLTTGEARDRALKVIERDGHDLTPEAQRQVERLVRRADGYVARRTLLTENDDYRSAFVKSVMSPSPRYTDAEARAMDRFETFERDMNITTPADGGYGVPVLIDPTIILTAQESTNPFMAISDVKTITTNAWKGVSSAGVTWDFDPEATETTDNSPTLAQPAVTAHKAQGFIPFSIEVGQDYPGFAADMARLLAAGYDELLVQKFTVGAGDGSNEPFGIFTAIDATAGSEVSVGTDGQLHAADIFKVWKALPQKYRRNASWLMNVDVNTEIRSLGDDKLFQQTVDLRAGAADILMGRPVYESPYAPEFTGTTGAANILIVGDFSNYVVAQRAGMSVELVPHLVGSNNRPTGQRGWYAWARVGADSVNDAGFRLLQNT